VHLSWSVFFYEFICCLQILFCWITLRHDAFEGQQYCVVRETFLWWTDKDHLQHEYWLFQQNFLLEISDRQNWLQNWIIWRIWIIKVTSIVIWIEVNLTKILYTVEKVILFVVVKYTVSQKNDNDVLFYNFNAHQPILVIFGRHIAEWICY